MTRLRIIVLTLLTLVSTVLFASIADSTDAPIVIISSYNPEIKNINDNINDFSNEYVAKGGLLPIKVENMNCRNLSESPEWKARLLGLLSPYYENGKRPAAIVLLGVEASSTYFSIDNEEIKSTPVLVGMRSVNLVKVPDDSIADLRTWNPESYDVTTDFPDYNIVGGSIYKYDVDKNIQLIKHLYPRVDSLAFLSDNSFGGVTIRSHFMKMMKSHSEYTIQSLDGRTMTFNDVNNAISQIKGDKAIVIGTWRIDSTDSYALGNTAYSFSASNTTIPAFALSSVGLGFWAIGGFVPDYQPIGKHLAESFYAFEQSGKQQQMEVVRCVYKFDFEKLNDLHISRNILPKDSEILNEPVSAWRKYWEVILGVTVVIIILLGAFLLTAHHLRLSKKLSKRLEVRGYELEVAKEAAENAKEAAEVAKEAAEAANKMKSQFIANMSHEIRTPLNAVIGFSQMLTNPNIPISDEERMEFGIYIKSNSDVLLNLINDILDISKVDAGTMKYNISEADIVRLCHTATESARNDKMLAPGVQIISDLPDHPVVIETDPMRILQILNNIFSNAKKFTEKGSITISLDESDADYIKISITDTGSGIPADKAETIFERFKQLDSFKQGTGLGLSIVRTFVENFGGKIWVDTTYTDGARFIFTLPRKSNALLSS